MGLIGGIARTAVVAGTFTAVSNRVSRRAVPALGATGSVGVPAPAVSAPQQYPPQQYAPPPPAPPPAAGSDIDLLTKVAQFHEQGVLTDEEFAAEKAKILGI